MDRPTTRKEADAQGARIDPQEAFVLPSRRPALDLCRGSLYAPAGASSGPVLVTGDAGVGKTWLWRRLEAEAAPACRWVAVDLTPANSPADFYRLLGHELGLADSPATGISRVELVEFLADRLADSERRTLVIEEAHNLSMPVWEEVRVLANRLGRPGGFAGLVLVGQTSLARKFSTRPFAAIEARLAARVHLGPIDADEAHELLIRLDPAREWTLGEVEALHRDSVGNPRRMLRRLGLIPVQVTAPTPIEPAAGKVKASIEPPAPTVAPALRPASPVPLTGPDRPPIQVEDNMIEVGWSPEENSAADELEQAGTPLAGRNATSPGGEEAVHDHYAALQAWREWTENQAHHAPPPRERPGDQNHAESDDELDPDYEADEEDEEGISQPAPRADRPSVRAEGEQPFAPFGQLFSRMAQAREPDLP